MPFQMRKWKRCFRVSGIKYADAAGNVTGAGARNFIHTYQMGYDILSAVDHYGNELNTEVKRRLMQQCEKAPRFLREMLAGFHEARQNIIWVNRMARSRECCAIQLDTFADMIRSSARELENSIFSDDRLKRSWKGRSGKRA